MAITLGLVVSLANGLNAESGVTGFIQETNVLRRGVTTTSHEISLNKAISKEWGLSFWGQRAASGWTQFYCGPTFSPNAHVSFSAGLGTEEAKGESSPRFGGSCWLGLGPMSLLYVAEYGELSGHWHRLTANYAVSSRLGIGILSQAGVGTGPRLEWRATKSMKLWVAPLKDRVLVGLKTSF